MVQTAIKSHQSRIPQATLHELGVSAVCLSAEHAAAFLGLPTEHARRIRQLGQHGKLPRVAVGRTFVFPITALEEYVKANTQIGVE